MLYPDQVERLLGENLTEQEVFDGVVTHLARQGRRAVSKKGNRCLYRAPDGCKCAFGIAIRDDEYDTRIESESADVVLMNGGLSSSVKITLLRARLRRHVNLIGALQHCHDQKDSASFKPLVDRLRSTADDYMLDCSILDFLIFPKMWS